MEIDIHNFSRRLKHILGKIQDDEEILDANKTTIMRFYKFCRADGLKTPSIVKDLYSLWFMARGLKKKFEDANKDDLVAVVSKVESVKKWTGWTKRNHKVALKKFIKWLKGYEDREYPDEVKWIRTGLRELSNKLPEELLTEEEIMKMVAAADNPRDRAFILTLYESGARIGEILTMKIKHVVFEKKDYTLLMLNGKTGMRRIPVIACSSALATWMENHPIKDDPGAFLWVTKFNRFKGLKPLPKEKQTRGRKSQSLFIMLSYPGARKILKNLAKRAGIKKRVYPHLLRHTSATRTAVYLTEAQQKEYYGWSKSSTMPGIYTHLAQKDILSGVLKMHGKLPKERQKLKVTSIECPRCKEVNDSVSKFCKRCGSPLDLKTVFEMEKRITRSGKVLNYIIEHEEYRLKLEKLFDEIGKEKLREAMRSK